MFRAILPGTADEQRRFLARLHRSAHGEGDVLFREGDHGDELFLILRGGVALLRLNDSADLLRLAELKPGQMVGEMAMICPGPRSATAITEADTIVASVDRERLLQLLVRRDPIARGLLRSCTEVVIRRLRRTRDITELVRQYNHGVSADALDRGVARLRMTDERLALARSRARDKR